MGRLANWGNLKRSLVDKVVDVAGVGGDIDWK